MQVLDHGYIKLVESWGSDEAIIEAARMSTQKGFIAWDHYRQCRLCDEVHVVDAAGSPSHPGGCSSQRDGAGVSVGYHDWRDVPKGDAGLLRYLYTNHPPHSGPFEFAGLVVEVQAPIFVFREWHRHRTQSYNEMSARYAPLPDFNYVPTIDRLMMGGGTNKQANAVDDAELLTEETAREFQKSIEYTYAHAQAVYESALRKGVPKELARVHLPVGRYSRMRASANLRNWLGFMTLRAAPTAQWEIRQYADALGQILADRFPRTWALFAK